MKRPRILFPGAGSPCRKLRRVSIVTRLRTQLLATCLLLPSSFGLAQDIRGLVSDVTAGDRLVLKAPDRTIRVQLANIDVPDRGEPLGDESWQSLRELCLWEAATLIEVGTALDGSTVGEVSCGGVQADEEQLRRGLARVEPHLLALDSKLRAAQQHAQAAQAGIWSGQ